MDAKIRISYGIREIEIEGSEIFVREQLENFSSTIEAFALSNVVDKEVQEDSDGRTIPNQEPPEIAPKLPETFGEYLSHFSKGVRQDEQILIAGYFAQGNSSEKSFTTKEANDLLKEQGVKLTNPSQSVSHNKGVKRVFATKRGSFRVSQDGIDHIKSLRGS